MPFEDLKRLNTNLENRGSLKIPDFSSEKTFNTVQKPLEGYFQVLNAQIQYLQQLYDFAEERQQIFKKELETYSEQIKKLDLNEQKEQLQKMDKQISSGLQQIQNPDLLIQLEKDIQRLRQNLEKENISKEEHAVLECILQNVTEIFKSLRKILDLVEYLKNEFQENIQKQQTQNEIYLKTVQTVYEFLFFLIFNLFQSFQKQIEIVLVQNKQQLKYLQETNEKILQWIESHDYNEQIEKQNQEVIRELQEINEAIKELKELTRKEKSAEVQEKRISEEKLPETETIKPELVGKELKSDRLKFIYYIIFLLLSSGGILYKILEKYLQK